jgi:tetratricopeptide (TPR) repeat protein
MNDGEQKMKKHAKTKTDARPEDGGAKRGARYAWTALAAVLVAAAAVRLAWIIGLRHSEIGQILPLDMRFYRDLAAGFAAGGGAGSGALTFNPLYPVLLSWVFRLFGDGLLAPRIIQSLIGIGTIGLTYVAARMLGGVDADELESRLAGVLAAAIALLYPQLLLYEGALLATTVVVFLFAASLVTALAIARAIDRDPPAGGRRLPWAALGLGLLLGAGALGRPNLFLLLAPLVTIWLYLRAGGRIGGGSRRALRLVLPCAAGIALMMAPPAVYNAARTGKFVPVTTHGGINFYIGNGPSANGLYRPPEGMREDMRGLIEDAAAAASTARGRELDDAEVSAYWSARARERIVSDPAGWLRLLGRKFLFYWNGAEYGDILDYTAFAEQVPVLRLLPLPFTVISPLAFAGLLVLLLRSRHRAVTAVFLAASLASVMLFYFNSRYRMPSMPLLIAAAGVFPAWAFGAARRRHWKGFAAALAVAVLWGGLVSGREMIVVNRSAVYTFLGNHYMSEGERFKGLQAFRRAHELDPDGVGTTINYARGLRVNGMTDEALEQYGRAWEADPRFPHLAVEYGSLLEEAGRREDARRFYLAAWESGRDTDRVLACKHLARAAYADGRIDEAIEWISRGLDVAPGDQSLVDLLNRLEGR